MRDPFIYIEQRTREFSNHFSKHLQLIKRVRPDLIELLEHRGILEKVHLYQPTHDLRYEMDAIAGVSEDRELQLELLGTYYSLQHLLLNIRCIDILQMSLMSGSSAQQSYIAFMKQIGRGFRHLTGTFMETVLYLHVDPAELGEFVVLGVGTRADQDDIDVGIIDRGDHHRRALTEGIGKMAQEMMKRSCYLHFHLSEHVGGPCYSASIPEYRELLDRQLHDFIIINEMLIAWPIFGSWELYREFRREITDRYYFQEEEMNSFHEGFLRGMLGEIFSLRIQRMKEDRLHPKEDALRIIKGIMSVAKTILNIHEIGSWDVITLLKRHSTDHQKQFQNLEESLIFIETFRFLYQHLVCQSEDVFLVDDNDRENLNTVAQYMGFRDLGVIKAWNHLLIAYHSHVQQVHQTTDELLPWISGHLNRYSEMTASLVAFHRSVRASGTQAISPTGGESGKSIVTEFADRLQFFHGIQFWDDIVRLFLANDGELLHHFCAEFDRFDEKEKSQLLKRYAACANFTSAPMIKVLIFLAGRTVQWRLESCYDELFHEFLAVISTFTNADERMIKLFNHDAKMISDLFQAIPFELVSKFAVILRSSHWDDSVQRSKLRLLRLLVLHQFSSRYFKRFFVKIIQQNPGWIKYLDKSAQIETLSMGILGKVEELDSYRDKKEQLGLYYDIEFTRVAIQVLLGEDISRTNEQFTSFVDNYMQMLFDICKQEVDFQTGHRTETRDLLAVFSSGGHAREQAFDNDYDIIVLLDAADDAVMDYAMKIISKMNSEIIKRGTLPHYRFADYFGNYVTTLTELEAFFSGDEVESRFIEQSQLLGCRMLVGSKEFVKRFNERILQPFLVQRKKQFITDMIGEYRLRHESPEDCSLSLDVKECQGGLRDIEMLLMIYKSHFEIRRNISDSLFDMIVRLDPDNEADLRHLQHTFKILSHVRDLYRLLVTVDDEIFWAELTGPLDWLISVQINVPYHTIDQMREKVIAATARTSSIIDRLMYSFHEKVNTHDN